MDIEYLLWLQGLREAAGKMTEFIFAAFSDSVYGIIMIPLIIYYIINKKKGIFILASAMLTVAVNSLIKLTVCVNRPWIRDARLHVSKFARNGARGYSFPSGHASTATSVGASSIAAFKPVRLVKTLILLYIIFITFSRNFLGCHTPQDVIAGVAEALLVIFAVSRIKKAIGNKPESDLKFFILGAFFLIAGSIYIFAKPYPLHYDSAGKLLVDPVRMQASGLHDIGLALGFLIGWFLERRFVNFSTDNLSGKQRFVRIIIFFGVSIVSRLFMHPLHRISGDPRIVKFLSSMIFFIVCIFVVPLIFSKVEASQNKES